MKDKIIDSDEHYDPDFYKFASNEIIEKFYPLIGQVASVFNSLDDSLNEDLIVLVNDYDYEIGWIVISNMSFSNKADLWEKLLCWFIHSEENLSIEDKNIETAQVKAITKDLKDLAIKRNKIVHADWEGMNDKLLVKNKTKSSDKGVRHHYLSIKQEEFDKLIDQFNDTENKFNDFAKTIKEKLGFLDSGT